LVITAGGSATATVSVPSGGVIMNIPLRLRVVADNPGGSTPTACSLVGTAVNGVGQVEDYAVVIMPRTVLSIASGSWTTPATWSCNCVPTSLDIVTIQAAHIISISSGLKQALTLNLMGKLQYEAGGRLQLAGN
jgi:hypothetical protein